MYHVLTFSTRCFVIRDVVKLNQLSVKINLLVSDIFGTLLPFKHRDPGQARHYVFQAFRFGQNASSKANHRMALTLLCNIKSPVSTTAHHLFSHSHLIEIITVTFFSSRHPTQSIVKIFLKKHGN